MRVIGKFVSCFSLVVYIVKFIHYALSATVELSLKAITKLAESSVQYLDCFFPCSFGTSTAYAPCRPISKSDQKFYSQMDRLTEGRTPALIELL